MAGCAGAGIAVIPALAADGSVVASGFSFDPPTVQIQPGEKVTWTNGGGTHNVHFQDGQFDQPADPTAAASWPADVSRTFAEEGEYRYYCELHGTASGGMSGRVIVGEVEPTPTPGPDPTPTPSPDATPTPSPGDTAPRVSVVRTKRRYCVGPPKRCRRPGFVLRVDAGEAIALRAAVRRDGKSVGTVGWTAQAGVSTIRFRRAGGRRLRPGRYRLAISAPDHPALEFDAVRFRVVRR